MRKAVYEFLKTNCQSIINWYQPGQATAETAKPYGVIVLGDVSRSLQNRLGEYKELTLWPYFGGSSYLTVDAAVKEIRRLFRGAVLVTESGARFEVEFVREGRDFYDPDLKALTRRIEFRIPQIGG